MTATPDDAVSAPEQTGAPTTVPAAVAAVAAAQRSSVATDIALIGTAAALLAVCSLVSVPIGPSGAPITLQTFAVLLAGMVLGARRGALAALLYLAVGAAGIPVFAGGAAGAAVLVGPTGGYLIAFPIAALVTGLVVERARRRGWRDLTGTHLLAGALGSVVIYLVGVPMLAAVLGLSLTEAWVINLAFIPLDVVKLVLAAVVATSVHRAFPDLTPGR